MLVEKIRRYVLIGLEGTPAVMRSLTAGLSATDAAWDRRPDPERFTLREVVAHLADWDEIFLIRMQRTLNENRPTLPDIDEGQIAEERRYAQQDPHANLKRFSEGRTSLLLFLRGLDGAGFARTAVRPELGELSIEDQSLLVLAHDSYHTKQTAEYMG